MCCAIEHFVGPQVHVERMAKAIRLQRATADKAAAEAHVERLAAGQSQREPLPSFARCPASN